MDETVVLSKLESLRRCVERVREKTPASANELSEDYDLQDIICINLERAVQLCVDVCAHVVTSLDSPAPDSMSAGFGVLEAHGFLPTELAGRLKKAVGFRNISVHRYQEMDWAIVYSIITERLDDFAGFARHIADRLEADNSG